MKLLGCLVCLYYGSTMPGARERVGTKVVIACLSQASLLLVYRTLRSHAAHSIKSQDALSDTERLYVYTLA